MSPTPLPPPTSVPVPPPKRPPKPWPIPQLHLRIDDLAHDGATVFLAAVRPYDALHAAVLASFEWLYTQETVPRTVKHILLVLRSMPGVAVTFGTQSHKEIHFSLEYIKATRARAQEEICGVLVHEVVHCYQQNGHDAAPSGLIEGVADYVRLRAALAPPHWRRRAGPRWDAGYDTTAYFLEWIEKQYGDGTVRALNEWMRDQKYRKRMFKQVIGERVGTLWDMYCKFVEDSALSLAETSSIGEPDETTRTSELEGESESMDDWVVLEEEQDGL